MKKIINIVLIFSIVFLSIFSIKVYAASLDTIDITTNKQTVHPGESVTVGVAFGQNLGAYTVDVAYDSNLFEYVSAEGGTANDTGTKVRVYFYDQAGGTSPRSSMSVTFKAKTGITTSNPTDFSITAEGLANADASISYDDITTPIVKNVVVEPVYVDYDIALNYSGDVLENEEKDMKLVVSSSMGKNYEHTRIIAEATSQTGGTAKLLATDSQSLEHDIIQSGWGDASGDAIGGKDVAKELSVRGLFTKSGDYTLTLKLIDRDNSDAEIASKVVNVTVKEKGETTTPDNNNGSSNNQGNNNAGANAGTNSNQPENTKEPEKLPKTGSTIYFVTIPIIALLIATYVILKKKDFER